MKPTLVLLLVIPTMIVHAGVVTITATPRDSTNGVAELSIGQYEVAELLSYVPGIVPGINSQSLTLLKDGGTNYFLTGASATPLIVAGPATFRLTASPSSPTYSALATFRISPEPFPPDRTVIALPGTNQTSITLECSSNLVDWASATNGVYGPMPEAKFFRIKLQRQ